MLPQEINIPELPCLRLFLMTPQHWSLRPPYTCVSTQIFHIPFLHLRDASPKVTLSHFSPRAAAEPPLFMTYFSGQTCTRDHQQSTTRLALAFSRTSSSVRHAPQCLTPTQVSEGSMAICWKLKAYSPRHLSSNWTSHFYKLCHFQQMMKTQRTSFSSTVSNGNRYLIALCGAMMITVFGRH